MGKKIIVSAALFCFVFISAGLLKAKAGSAENVSGWLWGGSDTNVGWISANNTSYNCDTDGDGKSNGKPGCPAAGLAIANYGLNIPATNGEISGYAWSENVGAIAFENSNGYLTGCPSEPCIARRVGDKLEGWARFVEIKKALDKGNSGGWQGWIKLNPKNGGVSIDKTTGNLKGYAWSDELGWIDFSKAKIGPEKPVCTPDYICSKTKPVCPQLTGMARCINKCNNDSVSLSLCGETCKPETITCENPSSSGVKMYNYREVAP